MQFRLLEKIGKYFVVSIYSLTAVFVTFVFKKIFINGNLDYVLPDRFPKILSRLFLFIVIFVISFIFIFLLNNLKSIIHNKSFIVIALLVIPLLMSLILIITTKVEPKSDFLTYFLIARNLSLNKIFIPNYIAMFPHTISFPFFLSLMFRIFGSSVFIAQLTGSVLSTLSVILIYVIGKEIGNRELGFFAALLWTLMPSRILYSLLICTENLFNVVALAITFLFIKTLKTTNTNKRVLHILLIGIFSAWLSSIRPNGILISIAIILYFLFFAKINLTSPNMLKIFRQNIFPIKLFLTLITIITYLLTALVINYTIESKIRQKIASPRIGWNMYVGLNINSHGQWNKNDSQLFEKLIKEKGPTQAQKIFLELSLKRLNAIVKEKKVISFAFDKIITMWHADHEAYDYAAGAQSKNLTAKIKLRKVNKIPKLIMNVYYLSSLLLSLVALFLKLKNNDFTNPLIIMGCFIILGTILLHIPFETALRYKNHSLIWFCFIAAQGITEESLLLTKFLSKRG